MDSAANNAVQCARRFDPENNPSNDKRPEESEEISLLITTDVLSEGVNLQAGQVVINYDFHWNPVRLIQRAGRVDRIGSRNESVTVHNFLPDPEIEKDLGLEAAVSYKIDEIQRVIGEDYKILTENETINTQDVYAIYNGDGSILDREEDNPLEPSKYEQILRDIQVNDPAYWEELRQIPDGIRSAGRKAAGGRLLLACEGGSASGGKVRKYYLADPGTGVREMTSSDALEILQSDDREAHPEPEEYDALVAACWKRLLEDTEQIRARSASGQRLGSAQKWALERLTALGATEEVRGSDRDDRGHAQGALNPDHQGKAQPGAAQHEEERPRESGSVQRPERPVHALRTAEPRETAGGGDHIPEDPVQQVRGGGRWLTKVWRGSRAGLRTKSR